MTLLLKVVWDIPLPGERGKYGRLKKLEPSGWVAITSTQPVTVIFSLHKTYEWRMTNE